MQLFWLHDPETSSSSAPVKYVPLNWLFDAELAVFMPTKISNPAALPPRMVFPSLETANVLLPATSAVSAFGVAGKFNVPVGPLKENVTFERFCVVLVLF